ncbi:MAG: UvrB/UvrC motif-containing protein, partial [bacterium]
ERSPYQKKPDELTPQSVNKSINELLAGLLGTEPSMKVSEGVDLTCPTCGHLYKNYKKTLLLGCPHCYVAFGEHLTAELRKFHGAVEHHGRTPKRWAGEGELKEITPEPEILPSPKFEKAAPQPEEPEADLEPSVADLRKMLQQAINREDFETAAKLRDEIRELEKKESENIK